MNKQDKAELRKIIGKIRELKDLADLKSRTIIEYGTKIPLNHRTKSEGYSSAYSFCALILERFLDGKKMKW